MAASHAFIGPTLLARLVAEKVGKEASEVEQILNCHSEVVLALLNQGARVRILGVGYFDIIKTKATRRKSPLLGGEYVKVPAKKKIVFRASQTTRKK